MSEGIWTNPELDYNEHKAHALFTNFLEGKGFHMERSAWEYTQRATVQDLMSA